MAHWLLKRRGVQGLSARHVAAHLGLVVFAVALGAILGRRERDRLQDMIIGMAPTYAAELATAGHHHITLASSPEDPAYLDLIEMQKRWLAFNPQVADIYTVAKVGDQFALLVDSETDYDRSGSIDQDREARTDLGELLEDVSPEFRQALEAGFGGESAFLSEPITDRWGTWVTGVHPISSPDGSIHAVLGIDFDARRWIALIIAHRAGGSGLVLLLGVIMLTHKAAHLQLQSEMGKRQQTESDLRKSEAELALARYRDRVRMDELERIVDARTRDLKVAATHDKLTGLPNRAQLHEVISSALSRSRLEAGYSFSLLFLDFDRFKIINDSLGHAAGDMLLTGIAQRLRRALAETQHARDMHTTVARLGGDEFCIVLGGVQHREDVEAFSAKLLERLGEPHHLSGREVHSSASIGITHASLEYQQAEEMLRDADTAMYRAKSMGRSRFVVFDQQMHIDAIRRLVLENDLRGAVERGELKLVYQPVIQLDNNRIVSAEALVRWHHPTRGLIPPMDFITVAEENGLIHAIGLWTLERAAEQVVAWSERFPDQHITISVNVSRKQLGLDLIEELRSIRARTGVKPEQLILEITETTLTEHPTLAREVLEALQAEGFSIYLDDFGTGYSSLSCLTNFPLDGIKLDRSFISDSTGRRDRVALIHGMVTLAHDLELTLVAEGIESIEQAAMLETLQCHRGQGFLFARPTDPFTLERLLEEAEGSVGCLARAA